MNRSESLWFWKRLADGKFDTAALEWLQRTAQQVVDVDSMPDAVRPGEMLRAVGLWGRADKTGPLRDQLALLDSFPFVDENGERAPARGERMSMLMAAARASGLLQDDPEDHELRKRIERMLGTAR